MTKKYTNKEKAEALKRLQAGESASAVSREMKIPRSTLLGWLKGAEKGVEPTGAGARKKTTRAREKTSAGSTGGKNSEKGIVKSEKVTGEEKKSDAEKAEEKEQKRKSALIESKKKFSTDSWDNIKKAQKIINRRLDRALRQEDVMDEIVNIVLEADGEDLSEDQKKALLQKLRKIRVDDVRDVVVVIGTLYDKQALANDEATNIIEGGLQVEFNIPRPPKRDKNES